MCVYFWLSASVSMAADASQRKALRYQQTLVSHCLYMPLFLSPVVLWSYLKAFRRLPVRGWLAEVCRGRSDLF